MNIEQAREVSVQLHTGIPVSWPVFAADTIDALIAEVERLTNSPLYMTLTQKLQIIEQERDMLKTVLAGVKQDEAKQRKVLEQALESLIVASRRFDLLAAHNDNERNGLKPSAGYADCQVTVTAIQEQLK